MKRWFLLIVVVGALAGCGREGPLVSGTVAPTPETTTAPLPTSAASPSPEPTASATPMPTPSAEITASPAASAPTTRRAGVSGSVVHGPVCEEGDTDCEGRPIGSALVKARSQDGGEDAEATTDSDGRFSIALEPGSYIVGVSTRSYSNCEQETVEVSAGYYTPIHLTCDQGG